MWICNWVWKKYLTINIYLSIGYKNCCLRGYMILASFLCVRLSTWEAKSWNFPKAEIEARRSQKPLVAYLSNQAALQRFKGLGFWELLLEISAFASAGSSPSDYLIRGREVCGSNSSTSLTQESLSVYGSRRGVGVCLRFAPSSAHATSSEDI